MTTANADDAIIKEIIINAPAERVFDAIVDPGQRPQWWGSPGKFQVTDMQSDLRPGGAWSMRGAGMGGAPFSISGQYRAVERPRVVEFTWLPDWHEPETVVRFDLEEKNGVTKVRVTHSGFAKGAARDKYQGWPWLLALLRDHVQGAPAA